MGGIITGMVIGSMTIIAVVSTLMYFGFKNHSLKKLTKKLGKTAEDIINGDIAIWAKHTKNKYIKASLYRYGQNKVFEVDGILITDKGIVVVEIKSIKGVITGDALNPKWTKNLGSNKFSITNPVIQNDKHIEHIMNMTKIKVPIVSLIIYSNRSETISVTNIPGHVVVIRHAELYNTLDEINSSLKSRISESQLKSLHGTIKAYRTNKIEDINLHKDITQQKR